MTENKIENTGTILDNEFVLLFNYKKEVGNNIVGHFFGKNQDNIPIYSIKNDLIGFENIVTFSVCDHYVFLKNEDMTAILIAYLVKFDSHIKNIKVNPNKGMN